MGVEGWQDKKEGLRGGSPALSSPFGYMEDHDPEARASSQGQATECPGCLVREVFLRHFPYAAQGISAEAEGPGSHSPPDTPR